LEVVNPRHPICRGIVRRCTRHAQRQWEQLPAIRINGPIFFPKDRRTMVLSYDWEQRLGAVLAGAFGHGRAVAISPHPERTQNETAPDSPMRSDDLMPAAGILRNALYWAAGRAVPPVR
jgi:hypothetical protein